MGVFCFIAIDPHEGGRFLMASSEFIPNAFQTPNAYVDKFMAYLTAEEWKVLSYFVRRIFGFNKRQDRLSYSQIMNGYVRNGVRVDAGTGLGAAAAENAVKGLLRYRLIVKLEENNQHENKGPLYALQMDSEQVDLSGLIDRTESRQQRVNERMSKARNSRKSENVPPSNEQTHPYSITPPPPYSITGGVGLSNNGHNKQGYTEDNQKGANAPFSAPLAEPEPPAPQEKPPYRDQLWDLMHGKTPAEPRPDAVDVEWLAADVLDLGRAFLEATRLPPPRDKSTRGYWIKELRAMRLMDELTQDDIRRAVRKMRDYGGIIKSPESVRTIALDMRAANGPVNFAEVY